MLKPNQDLGFKSLPYLCMYTLLKLTKAGIYTLLTHTKQSHSTSIYSAFSSIDSIMAASQWIDVHKNIYLFVLFWPVVSVQGYIWRLSDTMEMPFHLPTRYGTELCVLAFYDTILTHKPWFARRRRKIDANSSDTEHVIRNFGFIFARQLSLTTTSFVWGRCDTSFLN